MMLSPCLQEFRDEWLPHVTTSGLNRLIDLLESASSLLVHGTFTNACARGCLATHIAWHHPETSHLSEDAGIMWLYHIAGLNPATSLMIRTWDESGQNDWRLRDDLLTILKEEKRNRSTKQHVNRCKWVIV